MNENSIKKKKRQDGYEWNRNLRNLNWLIEFTRRDIFQRNIVLSQLHVTRLFPFLHDLISHKIQNQKSNKPTKNDESEENANRKQF